MGQILCWNIWCSSTHFSGTARIYVTENTGLLFFLFVKIELSYKMRIEFKWKHWQHFFHKSWIWEAIYENHTEVHFSQEYLADVQLQLFNTKENMSYPRTPAKQPSQGMWGHPRATGISKGGAFYTQCETLWENGNSDVRRAQDVWPSSDLCISSVVVRTVFRQRHVQQ